MSRGDLSHKLAIFKVIAADPDLPSTAKVVGGLLFLKYHNEDTGQCNPSITTLGADAGLKRRETVVEAIRSLEKAGWIGVERTTAGRTHKNNYALAFDRVPEPEKSEKVRKSGGRKTGPIKESGFPGEMVRSNGAKTLKNNNNVSATTLEHQTPTEFGGSKEPHKSARGRSPSGSPPRSGGKWKKPETGKDVLDALYPKEPR